MKDTALLLYTAFWILVGRTKRCKKLTESELASTSPHTCILEASQHKHLRVSRQECNSSRKARDANLQPYCLDVSRLNGALRRSRQNRAPECRKGLSAIAQNMRGVKPVGVIDFVVVGERSGSGGWRIRSYTTSLRGSPRHQTTTATQFVCTLH